jgi:glycosyltransferase involved in cell wall biosynthesis
MLFSIIIPTFERRQALSRSIDSSIVFARTAGETEIVVVDDASHDGTAAMIRERYALQLASRSIKLVERRVNGGVTAARNDGIRAAGGDRLILLDSDDQLLPVAAQAIQAFAAQYGTSPILFFRCEDESGSLIGPPASSGPLDLDTLLTRGTPGECLPVISRVAFLTHPYDEDLRGFEYLAYLRIVQSFGPAMLSETAVRRYATAGTDRLSTLAGRLRRADLMALGFARMRAEFGDMLGFRQQAALVLRFICYRLAAIVGFGRRPLQ